MGKSLGEERRGESTCVFEVAVPGRFGGNASFEFTLVKVLDLANSVHCWLREESPIEGLLAAIVT